MTLITFWRKGLKKMEKTKMNRAIIFDSGALISLSMSGLINELIKLKENFNGNFLITEQVKFELVDKPIKIKRFELEALRIQELLNKKILEMPDSIGIDSKIIEHKAQEIMEMSNNFFESSREKIKIMQLGEASCLALSKLLKEKKIENVIVVDERTTRMLVEKPENLKELLQKKLHIRIKQIKENFDYFRDFKVIRSTELIYVAWKKGLTDLKDGKLVLDALLYALKFKGCAISYEEIEEIKNLKEEIKKIK